MKENYFSEQISIGKDEDLQNLVNKMINGSHFAETFHFETHELQNEFFNIIGISQDEFINKNFIYDTERNLHICKRRPGHFWISTEGLVVNRHALERYSNCYVNACAAQFIVVKLLFDNVIKSIDNENIFDLDSYLYNYLTELSLALQHNVIFYMELFGKAYLTLNNKEVKKKHRLSLIYLEVKKNLFECKHNNTMLHYLMHETYEKLIDYINSLSHSSSKKDEKVFREENVKYDDNKNDSTIVSLDKEVLKNTFQNIERCNDFITDYCLFIKSEKPDMPMPSQLTSDYFSFLLKKSKTENEQREIQERFAYLLAKE